MLSSVALHVGHSSRHLDADPNPLLGAGFLFTDVHLDIETKSEVDLLVVGLDVYARHPSTRVLMCSWKIEDGPVLQWTVEDGTLPPAALIAILIDPRYRKWAHNAQFERVVLAHVWKLNLPVEEWRCTMTWAYMLGLPGALDKLGEVLLLPDAMQKTKDGKRLIRKFSVPQKITKKRPDPWRNAQTDPEDWALFVLYNRQDVVAEFFIATKRLHKYPLPDDEWAMYHLDQHINDEGLPIDRLMVVNAVNMVEKRTDELLYELAVLTALENPNSDLQFGPWIRARGYPYNDLKKATVDRVLADPAMTDVHWPLMLRAQLKRTSVKKYFGVLQSTADDDRLRYTYQFCGASRTGRWAGRGAHFHNPKKPIKELAAHTDDIVASIRANDESWLNDMYGDRMKVLSSAVRGMIRAPDCYHLKVADLASIEACVIAWLARCESMLKVFHDGLDIYRDFGMRMYRKAYADITKEERDKSKPPCLGCGFRLSGGEEIISPKTGDLMKTGLWGYAANMGITLTRDEAHYAVSVYREAFPEVCDLWYEMEDAAKAAISTGNSATVGYITFDMLGPFMRMILPSGRALHYLRPKIEKRMTPWKAERWSITFEGMEEAEDGHKFWNRQVTHGGKLAENGTQAVANCVLRAGMVAARDEGFHIIGHSHDELITLESNFSPLTLKQLCGTITRDLWWAPGLPLSAAGYNAETYRKD